MTRTPRAKAWCRLIGPGARRCQAGLSTALGNALSLTLHDSTGLGSGSIDFAFSLADSNFDFLAEGETLIIKYNVSVIDSNHVSSIQQVTIIVTGTEDVPAITSGAQSGSVSEIADNAAGENTDIHHQSGTVTFTDVDLSDIETGSVTARQVTSATLANGYTLTMAQQNALLNAFTIDAATHSQANGTGTVGWHYDISDGALDFLGDTDQLTLAFTVQVDDGHGGTDTQDVVITVNGTEDAPVITSGPQSRWQEIADNAAGENTTVHHQSDTITFTDVDLSDSETGSVTARQVTGATLANGYTLTAAQQNALLNAFTIDAATHLQSDGTGMVVWHYDISDSALDFLGDDDQVTLTFTVQVDDGHGGLASQNVTITVNGGISGTEEIGPVITSGAQSRWGRRLPTTRRARTPPSTISLIPSLSPTSISPTVETSTVTSRQVTAATLANGYTLTAAQQNALLDTFSVDPATHSQADGTGTVGWHYDISDGLLDFLGDTDQLTLTFTVQVDDGHGGLCQPERHHHRQRHGRRAGDRLGGAIRVGVGDC